MTATLTLRSRFAVLDEVMKLTALARNPNRPAEETHAIDKQREILSFVLKGQPMPSLAYIQALKFDDFTTGCMIEAKDWAEGSENPAPSVVWPKR